MSRLPDGVQAQQKLHPFNALWEPYLPLFPTFIPQFSTLDALVVYCIARKAWYSLLLPLPLQRETSRSEKVSLGPAAPLGEQVMHTKSNCSSYPIQCVQTHSLLQQSTGTSNLETWTCLLFMGDCPSRSSPGPWLWQRSVETIHELLESKARMEVCLPITWYTGGQGFSRSLGV